MTDLKTAVESFRSSHESHFSAETSLGYGLDPNRVGANGIIVYVHHDDSHERETLLSKARKTFPAAWNGHPVYFKGMGVVTAYTRQ